MPNGLNGTVAGGPGKPSAGKLLRQRTPADESGAVSGRPALPPGCASAGHDRPRRFLMPSSRMNNSETLDIRHYLALYDPPAHKTELTGDCVPIHGGRVEVSELAALGFDIDPTYWRRQVALVPDMQTQVEKLYVAQLKLKVAGKKLNAPGRTVNRLFDSLQMFRRSFADSAGDWTGRVSLSTAFEMLLTDHYGKVKATLVRRSKELMRGQRGTRAMQRAIGDLYVSRSEFVHCAVQTTSADMHLARRAYSHCFLELSKRIDQIPTATPTPVGDVVVVESWRSRTRGCLSRLASSIAVS